MSLLILVVAFLVVPVIGPVTAIDSHEEPDRTEADIERLLDSITSSEVRFSFSDELVGIVVNEVNRTAWYVA